MLEKLFDLGVVTMTRGAMRALVDHNVSALSLLARHQSGDWGEVDTEDKKANNQAVQEGTRLLSSYTLRGGVYPTRVWLITEADRSATTFLLPDEY